MKRPVFILIPTLSLSAGALKGAGRAVSFVMMLLVLLLGFTFQSFSQGSQIFNSSQTFKVPAGVTSVTVQAWGGGGKGGSQTSSGAGGGGGGGAYSSATVSVASGGSYSVTVGAGSTSTAPGGDSGFGSSLVLAKGGNSVTNNSLAGASGGSLTNGIGTTMYRGGNGGNGLTINAGGGGSSAGTGANGVNGSAPAGGTAPSGGGNGGAGKSVNTGGGTAGSAPGGAGGGAYKSSASGGTQAGGNGANGRVVISWICPTVSISYAGTPFCKSVTSPQTPIITGPAGGTFSAGAGLSINSSSGAITPSTSTVGNYTVTYTIAASQGCGALIATTQVSITAMPFATFSYTGTPYCQNGANPFPAFSTGGVAGTFSSTSGLIFVSNSTGQVNLAASTAGTYTVTNTLPAAGSCGIVTATSTITITVLPAAVISYAGTPFCKSLISAQSVIRNGTSGGSYSSVPSGLTISSSTGAIIPGTSTAGTYTVTYTIPASGGCVVTTATTSVAILLAPSAPVVGIIIQTTCSAATGSVVLSGLPSSGTWTLTRSPGNATTSGSGTTVTVSSISPGSYTYTVTNSVGCVSPASSTVVINTQPSSPATPVQSVDCSLGFGHAVVTVASPTGAGLEYNLNGGTYQTSPVFTSVTNNNCLITVRNGAGCITFGAQFLVSCGCINPPTVTPGSSTGSTCGTTAVTVNGNNFGGTATGVTLSTNGAGTLSPLSANTSPFAFTYTPAAADGGKTVLITLTTNNPLGSPCVAGVATYSLTVNAPPTAPTIGTITNLTCEVPTGSVVLNGLPSAGTWTLTHNPGAVKTNGTGTSTTVSGLSAGTYNFTVTSAQGCASVPSADIVLSPPPTSPSAPVIGTITQPTCAISAGSVVLSGLPETGNWILIMNPGNVTISGTGTTATISALPSGTYTFSVTNSTGCISAPSENVTVNAQPPTPSAPSASSIIPPTCTLATGSVELTGLPSSGTWTLVQYPGTITTKGTGTSTTIMGLSTGIYNYTVTTADGCLSVPSANVVIPAQPPTPATPVVGTITQPTFAVPTGSVLLSGLPSSGTWVITRLPGAVTITGTGTSKTITGLEDGVYNFTVTSSYGCISSASSEVVITTPSPLVLIITNPSAVCFPATVNLTASKITAGSTPDLTYTYWTDPQAKISYSVPDAATAGTFYIKGTAVSEYYNIKPVIVTVDNRPVVNAGIDQILEYEFRTTLNATLVGKETGIWSLVSGSGSFYSETNPKTDVTNLSLGENVLLWSVTNGVCPASSDTVKIAVNDLLIPTLITPNMDGRNDYFILRGLITLGKTELTIFDRRGALVYKNTDYDNSWNGVDYNEKTLPEDTYYYVVKSKNGKSLSGYIVLKR